MKSLIKLSCNKLEYLLVCVWRLLIFKTSSQDKKCGLQSKIYGERAEFYLKDGFHVWTDEAGGVGDQVTEHTSTLLFVPANATVLQFC